MTNHRFFLFGLVGIVLIGGFLRVFALDTIPPGLYSDEAAYALDAVKTFETNDWKVFYPDNNGREGLYIWIAALMFKFFGIGIIQFRMVSALIGIATVAALYFFAKELFEEKRKAEVVALASSFFIATSFWHINFSRIGFRVILLPLVLTLFSYFLLRAVKNKKLQDFVLAGIVWGLGLYTYTAFRMALFIPLAVFIFEFAVYLWNVRPRLLRRKEFMKWCVNDGWWKWIVFGVTAVLLALPLAWHFFEYPEHFSSRTSDVLIFSKESPPKEFLVSTVKTLGMFHIRGDMNWRHNFAGHAQLFPPVGILFLVGFWAAFKNIAAALWEYPRKRKKIPATVSGYWLLVTWFFVMLLPATLTWEGIPHALRSIGVAPAAYVFAGIGFWETILLLDCFWRQKGLYRPVLIFLVASALLATGFIPFNTYLAWAKKPEVREAFSRKLMDIGNYLAVTYPETLLRNHYPVYIVDEDGPWEAGNSIAIRPIKFIVHGKTNPRYISLKDISSLAIPENEGVTIIPIYRDHDIYEILLPRYGERIESMMYPTFIVLRINPR